MNDMTFTHPRCPMTQSGYRSKAEEFSDIRRLVAESKAASALLRTLCDDAALGRDMDALARRLYSTVMIAESSYTFDDGSKADRWR